MNLASGKLSRSMSNFAVPVPVCENLQYELLKSKTTQLVHDVLKLSVIGHWGIAVMKYICSILTLSLNFQYWLLSETCY